MRRYAGNIALASLNSPIFRKELTPMTTTRHALLAAAIALVLAIPATTFAQSDWSPPDSPPPHHDHPHGPPSEAIAACKGKAIGIVASFTDREGGTISGACTQMGDVVAVPPPKCPHGDNDRDQGDRGASSPASN